MDEKEKLYISEINWCVDILERIQSVLVTCDMNDDKIKTISYLVKQGLKVKKED